MNFKVNFYSYKPRVSFYLNFDSETMPVVGDILRINKNDLSNISKKRKDNLHCDLEFKVIKRTFAKFMWINPNQYTWLIEVDFNNDYLHKIDERLQVDDVIDSNQADA
jgi:hypothetical protein